MCYIDWADQSTSTFYVIQDLSGQPLPSDKLLPFIHRNKLFPYVDMAVVIMQRQLAVVFKKGQSRDICGFYILCGQKYINDPVHSVYI